MVRIPGGSFQMGTEKNKPVIAVGLLTGEDYLDGQPADEMPRHAVVVQPFEMDPTEVTTAAYGECVKAGKCTATGAAPMRPATG